MKSLQEQEVRSCIAKLNIAFDFDTLTEIYSFLNRYVGPLSDFNRELNVFAAAAIVSQTRKIATVDGKGLTTNGVTVEGIMKNLSEGISKQNYLQTIKQQINKMGLQNPILCEKIGRVHISFRVFKKYAQIFEELSTQTQRTRTLLAGHRAFFWLIFLILKHKNQVDQHTSQSATLLFVILEQAFSVLIGDLPLECINQKIKVQFPSYTEIGLTQKCHLTAGVLSEIQETILSRTADVISFQRDPRLVDRLVDDLSNKCDREYRNRRSSHVLDEMSYLELTKDLTPQCIPQPLEPLISTKIDFSNLDEDEDYEFTTTERKPAHFNEIRTEKERQLEDMGQLEIVTEHPQRLISTKVKFDELADCEAGRPETITPVSMNMQAEQYMKGIENRHPDQQQIKHLLSEHQIEAENFIVECGRKVIYCMNEESPNVSHKHEECNKIMKMFIQYALQIGRRDDGSYLLSADNFLELLCTAHYLHDASLKFRNFKFGKYCADYGLQMLGCAKALFLIGENCKIPPAIQNKIKQIEVQVYLDEIWNGSTGYQLLQHQQCPHNNILLKRLNFHIEQRINDICRNLQIDPFLINQVEPLVSHLLTANNRMLQSSCIHQIIICSITAYLNLQLPKHCRALGDLSTLYNSLTYASSRNDQQQGTHRMDLAEFYSRVFLRELSDSVKGLNDANRVSFQLKNGEGSQGSFRKESLGSGHVQSPGSLNSPSLFSSPTGKNSFHSLKKDLVCQLKNPERQKQKEQALRSPASKFAKKPPLMPNE